MPFNPYDVMRNIPPEDAAKYFGANRSYEDPGGSIPGMSPEGNLWASIARIGEEQRKQEDMAREEAARSAQAKLTGQAQGQVTPSSKEDIIRSLMNTYEKTAQEGIQQRQSGINQLKDYAQQTGAMPRKADYTPFLSFVDSLGGGANLAKSYQRPETQEERMAKQFAMEQGIGKAQQGITEDQLKLMKERLDAEIGMNKSGGLEEMLKMMQLQQMMRGKELPETAVEKIAQYESGIQGAQQVLSKISNNQTLMGIMTGTITKFSPNDVAGRELMADLMNLKQQIGKAMEGGVLRKEDEDKYDKIIATITDNPKVAIYKLNKLVGDLLSKRKTYVDSLTKAGYYTSGFSGGNAPQQTSLLTPAQEKRLQELEAKAKR